VLLEETSIDGAMAILINVSGGEDLSLMEWKEISEMVTAQADPRANIIIGLARDESMREKVRVTVIATGFKKKKAEAQKAQERMAAAGGIRNHPRQAEETDEAPVLSIRRNVLPVKHAQSDADESSELEEDYYEAPKRPVTKMERHLDRPVQADPVNPDDLEIPAFLRRKPR